MSTDDDKQRGSQAPASSPFGHLIPGDDPRTPEQRQAAEMKENARRKGRRTKEWWKKEEDGSPKR